MDQKEIVLNHLKKSKSITSWDAIQKYGITRLADVIFRLKNSYNIVTIIEKAEGKRWAKYIYRGQK